MCVAVTFKVNPCWDLVSHYIMQISTGRYSYISPGVHSVMTALAAASAGCAAQMNFDDICAALESLQPAKGRGEIKPGPNGSTLIDDTYNANRQSIVAMLAAMRSTKLSAAGKRWAVLGDIFELGQYAPEEHIACGKEMAGTIDYLIAIGDKASFYVEGAMQAGMPEKNMSLFSRRCREWYRIGVC